MADLLIATQTKPLFASDGGAVVYVDSTTKELSAMDDVGNARQLRPLTNANTADVSAAAVDTYLTGSAITIPPQLVKLGTVIRWRFVMNKNGSQTGTAAPVWKIRVGTLGTTGDTAQATITANAQTASAADTGFCDIIITCTNAPSAIFGSFQYSFMFTHQLATTGLNNKQYDILQGASSNFDNTVATSIYGVSCNPGANSTWTFNTITAECLNV